VKNLKIDEFSKKKMVDTLAELQQEKKDAASLWVDNDCSWLRLFILFDGKDAY